MMLRLYKSAGDVEAEVLMMRQVHAGSFLIVEGTTDTRFWTSRVSDACELIDGNGKPNVEGAVCRLDLRGFRGALGIVDDDCDALERRALPSANLIATDVHDLECTLLRSPALERVLAELGSAAKIKKFEKVRGIRVRDALLEMGSKLGLPRWLSRRAGWAYPFEDNGPARFVDEATWTFDVDGLEQKLVAPGSYQTIEELHNELVGLPAADAWSICQGHDLVAILRIGLRRVLGDLKASTGVETIAGMLRTAYDEVELHKGHLGGSVRAWERVNAPYRIL